MPRRIVTELYPEDEGKDEIPKDSEEDLLDNCWVNGGPMSVDKDKQTLSLVDEGQQQEEGVLSIRKTKRKTFVDDEEDSESNLEQPQDHAEKEKVPPTRDIKRRKLSGSFNATFEGEQQPTKNIGKDSLFDVPQYDAAALEATDFAGNDDFGGMDDMYRNEDPPYSPIPHNDLEDDALVDVNFVNSYSERSAEHSANSKVEENRKEKIAIAQETVPGAEALESLLLSLQAEEGDLEDVPPPPSLPSPRTSLSTKPALPRIPPARNNPPIQQPPNTIIQHSTSVLVTPRNPPVATLKIPETQKIPSPSSKLAASLSIARATLPGLPDKSTPNLAPAVSGSNTHQPDSPRVEKPDAQSVNQQTTKSQPQHAQQLPPPAQLRQPPDMKLQQQGPKPVLPPQLMPRLSLFKGPPAKPYKSLSLSKKPLQSSNPVDTTTSSVQISEERQKDSLQVGQDKVVAVASTTTFSEQLQPRLQLRTANIAKAPVPQPIQELKKRLSLSTKKPPPSPLQNPISRSQHSQPISEEKSLQEETEENGSELDNLMSSQGYEEDTTEKQIKPRRRLKRGTEKKRTNHNSNEKSNPKRELTAPTTKMGKRKNRELLAFLDDEAM